MNAFDKISNSIGTYKKPKAKRYQYEFVFYCTGTERDDTCYFDFSEAGLKKAIKTHKETGRGLVTVSFYDNRKQTREEFELSDELPHRRAEKTVKRFVDAVNYYNL